MKLAEKLRPETRETIWFFAPLDKLHLVKMVALRFRRTQREGEGRVNNDQ